MSTHLYQKEIVREERKAEAVKYSTVKPWFLNVSEFEQFGSRTQKKDLPEPKRQRIEETPLELPEGFIIGDSPSNK